MKTNDSWTDVMGLRKISIVLLVVGMISQPAYAFAGNVNSKFAIGSDNLEGGPFGSDDDEPHSDTEQQDDSAAAVEDYGGAAELAEAIQGLDLLQIIQAAQESAADQDPIKLLMARDRAVMSAFGYGRDAIAVVTPRIFLSGRVPAENIELLRSLGITHILNLTANRYPSPNTTDFEVHSIHFSDEMDAQTLTDFFPNLIGPSHLFIEEALKQPNTRVLVHCDAGISRSSSVLISYFMKNARMSLRRAFNFIKDKKSNIAPNQGFFEKLIVFEMRLRFSKKSERPRVEDYVSSYPLIDYLADRLEGTLSGFGVTRAQIIDSLRRNNLDSNATSNEILSASFGD